MGIIFSGGFWGVVLILLGVTVLLKAFFNLDIPVFRILFGFLIIVFGLSVFLGRPVGFSGKGDAVFSDVTFEAGEDKYNTIFGKAVLDLKNIKIGETNKEIEVSTVFGETIVYLDPKIPTIVTANAAFGEVRLPGGNEASFGKKTHNNSSYKEGKPHLKLNVNVVFGSTKVRE